MREVLEFWFGAGVTTSAELEERMRFWFGKAPDATIRERFAALAVRAGEGKLDTWADGPRGRLALILLCDQFPRNLYRGTAAAFAHDAKALGLALSGMQVGADAALQTAERLFFYMPLQHAESRDVQDESVAAFRRLAAEAPEPLRQGCADALRYAELHRSIVERFGRFPHRNRVLGRDSSPEELAYLAHADTFGQ